MASEYKVGAVANVINPNVSKKKKKKKTTSSLFDNVGNEISPVFKPFTMFEVDRKSTKKKKKISQLKDVIQNIETKSHNGKINTTDKSEREQQRISFKRKTGSEKTDEEIKKRKERKIRRKEAKQKLQEETHIKTSKPKGEMLNKEIQIHTDKNKTADDNLKEQGLLFKRERSLKRADDEIQRRKERKIRKKEAKRKLREEIDDKRDEVANKKMKFSHNKAGNDIEAEERTIFVGNLPITVKRPEFKKYFSKIGPVESVRLRSAPISKPDISKRVAVLRQEFHPERTSINGFVVFTTKELAEKSLSLNGSIFEGHHIRVDFSNRKPQPDHKHSVFVGNLLFKTEEEDLWTKFTDCGEITGVRLIRDKETGIGKGFGYVTFRETDSVELALKLTTQELNGRKMRVSRSMKRKTKEEKMRNKEAIAKQSKKKNKGKSFGEIGSNHKKFQGVASKQGLKLKLAKKGKFSKKPTSNKISKSKKN